VNNVKEQVHHNACRKTTHGEVVGVVTAMHRRGLDPRSYVDSLFARKVTA
jgi:hypothetical protein